MSISTLKKAVCALFGAGALLGFSGNAFAELEWNMPQGVAPLTREIYDLHMLILWICVVVGVLVFGVIFYSIFRFRKSRHPNAAQFHESTAVEVVWTTIPFLILIGMAIPATKTLIAMEDTSNSDLTIKVTGYQWKWRYEYLDEDIGFFSNLAPESQQAYQLGSGVDPNTVENYLLDVDNPVVVPVDQKIRFLLTSNDVIHAWWVPAIAGKKDAIPGFVNELWTRIEEPGIYRGQCAELCGVNHGFMPIVVQALPQEEYAQWVAAQKAGEAEAQQAAQREWTLEDLMAKGEEVYNTNCASCHQAGGEGLPGTFPALKGSPVATGDVAEHIRVTLEGVPGTAMPPFGPQLSAVDLAAVITYERNAWGNATGDAVQPSDIEAARQ